MHSWKPRILTAVPQLPHVRFEIAEAMHKLAVEIEADNALRKRSERAEAERKRTELRRNYDQAVFNEMSRELGKRNFNPNEPRVPAGHREGGQWTNESWGGASSEPGSVLSDVTPDNTWRPGVEYAASEARQGAGDSPHSPLDASPPMTPQAQGKMGELIESAKRFWSRLWRGGKAKSL